MNANICYVVVSHGGTWVAVLVLWEAKVGGSQTQVQSGQQKDLVRLCLKIALGKELGLMKMLRVCFGS